MAKEEFEVECVDIDKISIHECKDEACFWRKDFSFAPIFVVDAYKDLERFISILFRRKPETKLKLIVEFEEE